MDEIKIILDKIRDYIKNKSAKENDLSFWLEFYICDNYDDIKKYNHLIARYLNDDVVDICEQTEPGLEGTNFRKEIEEAYYKLTEMMQKHS